MPEKPPPQSVKWEPVFLLLLLPAGIYVLWILLFPPISGPGPQSPSIATAKNDVMELVTAINRHRTEYGVLPKGSHAEILKTLSGDNERKVVFYQQNPKATQKDGELLDPWGTPYRIDTSDSALLKVYSCGPNTRDENGVDLSDDIVAWR